MNFGDKLRELIKEQDLTQKKFATQLTIAPSTLSSYIQNAREPDFETLKLFARYFNVTTDYLLNMQIGEAVTPQENELLRVFRALSAEQRNICLEQCKAFIRQGHKPK